MYLVALFNMQNLKNKILPADRELWRRVIFEQEMVQLSPKRIFVENPLM